MNTVKEKTEEKSGTATLSIGFRSFITVVIILLAVLFVAGGLSYVIPQGSFSVDENGAIIPDTYVKGEVEGIAIWRIFTAPVRVFASEDALTVIMISIFLLIMSGVFNILEKTGGIRVFIGRIMRSMRDKGGPVVCITVLIFMLFGSFFGMFEELVTLLPIVIMFMLSMNMDTMTGLGTCLLASCFGFSAAITNPFSVGLAAEVANVPAASGMWLRIVFFGIIYVTLCVFLMIHLRRIERDPKLSPSFAEDEKKRTAIGDFPCDKDPKCNRIFKAYSIFFIVQIVVLVLIASIRAISDLAIPILSLSFLVTCFICSMTVAERKRDIFNFFARGAASMLPAVVMIALASSVKLVVTESGIIDTIMNYVITLLDGRSKFLAIVLIYLLILFLQFFIGSASAKIILVLPIVMPIAVALGLSPALVILAYCMADGFTDVILPTNPVLLVGLSMSGVSYGKWVKWTWKLQLFVFVLTILMLFFGVAIGY